MTATPALTQTLHSPVGIITSAVSAQSVDNSGVVSNAQLIYTAGANGGMLQSILIASNDSAVRYVSVWKQAGGTGAIALLGTLAIPALSGLSPTGIIGNVDVFTSPYITGLTVDGSGRPQLKLEPLTKVYLGLVAALTANKVLYWITQAEGL